MNINSMLYKNEILTKKYLNINALYDKTNARLNFLEDDFEVEVDFNKKIYLRKTAEYQFKIDTLNEIASLNLIELNQIIELTLNYLSASFSEKRIIIQYKIESDEEFLNKIIIESSEL